jgi:hypothetical protein
MLIFPRRSKRRFCLRALKMFTDRLYQVEKELKIIQTALNRFERRFKKTSAEFCEE